MSEPQGGWSYVDDRDRCRIPYDWARVQCPTCGAAVDTRCRAKSGRTTDAHAARHQVWFREFRSAYPRIRTILSQGRS